MSLTPAPRLYADGHEINIRWCRFTLSPRSVPPPYRIVLTYHDATYSGSYQARHWQGDQRSDLCLTGVVWDGPAPPLVREGAA